MFFIDRLLAPFHDPESRDRERRQASRNFQVWKGLKKEKR